MIYFILSFKKNIIMPLVVGGLPVLRLIKLVYTDNLKLNLKINEFSRFFQMPMRFIIKVYSCPVRL